MKRDRYEKQGECPQGCDPFVWPVQPVGVLMQAVTLVRSLTPARLLACSQCGTVWCPEAIAPS